MLSIIKIFNGVWRSWLARLVWDEEVLGSSPSTPTRAGIVQWLEHQVSNLRIGVRLPLPAHNRSLYGGCSSMVERPPVEGKVAGSIPVSHPRRDSPPVKVKNCPIYRVNLVVQSTIVVPGQPGRED